LYFFTQKQETQQHYQFRTKTYYLILKEKILLKIKNTTQKIQSISNYYDKDVRRQWFGLQTVEETTILHSIAACRMTRIN
jgi:hypothetical protein